MTNNDQGGRSGLHEGDGYWDPGCDLGILDPGRLDSGYWSRFRFRVLTRAADELRRRRELAEFRVLDVVQSWA